MEATGTARKSVHGDWQVAAIAVALLIGQVAAAAVGTPGRGAALAADCFELAISVFASFSCYRASGRATRFAKSFWFVLGTAFAVWSAGQVLEIYLDLTVRSWPIVQTLLYFISITTIFMAVFGTNVETDKEAVHWSWVLDAIQILLLIISLYLLLVYVPTLIVGPERMAPLRLRLLHWRNVALLIGLLVRAIWNRNPSDRRLFAPLVVAMGIYAIGSYLGNHADLVDRFNASPWWGLAWSFPFTLVSLHAYLWRESDEVHCERAPSGVMSVVLVYLPSLAIPVLLLCMYRYIVKEQVIVGLSALMLSIVCFSLRLGLLHVQQQRTFDALRVSEERYRKLFESNVAAVFRSTPDGKMLECNQRFCEMFGYAREELQVQPAWILYPGGKEERDRLIADRIRSGVPGVFENKYRRKDGRLIWVLTSATMGSAADGSKYFEGTMLDVTERRRLEEQLFQAQRMEAVGRLAGGIAHDFNNVLTVITGYSAMLLARSDPSDPIYEDAQEIRNASERAASLTRQLLAFSRQQVLQPQVVNLNHILEGIAKMAGRLIGEDVDLSLRCTSNLKSVKADPGQIEQIVLNLVVNARDAMPSGGKLTLETSNVEIDPDYVLAHPYTSPGQHVLLAVSDTGIGMDESIRARIFEPFFTTKEHGKGTGLGLSTVYGIVKQSGGHIEVYSEVGKGSTFKIYFPAVAQAAGAAMAPAALVAGSEKGRETILLVEDDDALRKLALRALSSSGYRVLTPDLPQQAEAMVREHPGAIDLLLTDVVMPGISGREVARRVSVLRPNIRVLYMSGYTTNAIVDHGVLDEGLAFLPKPFTPATLTRKIREVLDGSRASEIPDAGGAVKSRDKEWLLR